METIRSSGQVVGPGIGGALVSLLDAANAIRIQAVTFAVSAASLLAIRTREPVIPAHSDRPRLRTQIIRGLSLVGRDHILRATATAIAIAPGNLSFVIASSVTSNFMSRNLKLSPTAIGLIIAGGSVTVMVGAACTPRLTRLVDSARIIWLSLAVIGPITLIGPVAKPGWSTVLIIIGTGIGEIGQIIYSITNVGVRQRFCPDRNRSSWKPGPDTRGSDFHDHVTSHALQQR